jgi:NTE family protein
MAYQAKEITFDGQLGKVYNNLQLMGKFELPYFYSYFISVSSVLCPLSITSKARKYFSHNTEPAFNQKDEYFTKLMATLPFLKQQPS